ncbi:uncharacterized protein LOC132742094 isoform X3 [Ruditapes philippinarum]|uniref:uncharacterized protein LOC132742094 isoform X3 n=1 Tax=Ruditapes philippinarum TaxID=129788 RepID=UPI00295A9A86|nr:uncharacterized protein LOC132742094 isoform X3 [Ruditapes philippinarum]
MDYSLFSVKGMAKYAVYGFVCLCMVMMFMYMIKTKDVTIYASHLSVSKTYITGDYQKTSPVLSNDIASIHTGRRKYDFNIVLPNLIPPGFIPDDRTKEISFQCKETFNKTLRDNLAVLMNYPRGAAEKYFHKLGVHKTGPDKMRTFPVFATAFDNKYFYRAQGLFKSIHERFLGNRTDLHVIVYDLGMTSLQYTKLKRSCKCEIRRFPFENFPPHVMELNTYAFKPIIVQMLFMEFGFVWWMDSSIRFATSIVDPAIDYVKKYSILHTVSTNDRRSSSMTHHTDNGTYEFLGEDRCKFRPFGEIWATTAMFHFDRVSRVAVEAWVTCALNKNCIAPDGSENKLYCDSRKDYDGRCHRFDQSVLGIITRRIFHEQNRYPLDYRLNDIYQINRDEYVPYFKL